MPQARESERSAGVLLHPTSLPGPYGAGDLGPAARRFVDLLAGAGHRWWQMLPIHPPDVAASPYLARSAFAGSGLLISPDDLAREGWIDGASLERVPATHRADFEASRRIRGRALAEAWGAFEGTADTAARADFGSFCERNAEWLEDWALYAAIKANHAGRAWNRWPRALRRREPTALQTARVELDGEIGFQRFVQFVFQRQWDALREYARDRGVRLFGDLPFFVAGDSADTWCHPERFTVDKDGKPTGVAGTPPDAFTDDGQLWGNPLYAWETHRAEGFRWWRARMRAACGRFERLRLDHFLGFVRAWCIDPETRDPRGGRYEPGPGAELFEALEDELGSLPFVVEDLGDVGEDVEALRAELGLPGIRVLVFAAGEDSEARRHRPAEVGADAVLYPATHDNDTLLGWYRSLPKGSEESTSDDASPPTRAGVRALFGAEAKSFSSDVLRSAYGSRAATVIVQLQDVLGLGSRARMNRPGTARGNWLWRVREERLDGPLEERLRELAQASGRASL